MGCERQSYLGEYLKAFLAGLAVLGWAVCLCPVQWRGWDVLPFRLPVAMARLGSSFGV